MKRMSRVWRKAAAAISVGGITASYVLYHTTQYDRQPAARGAPLALPSRAEQIAKLKTQSPFDILVIGGGATGCGIALDAATRGLKVGLVERDDFSSGTSSRSTKLLHGGVRYLEKAFKTLDKDQFALVSEALHEREVLLELAPHLANEIPILLPLYRIWEMPYMWAGLKVYDFIARLHSGFNACHASYMISKKTALENFPMLRGEGLCGAVVYHDGQHDDAAMCVSIALTAASKGATVANHVEVTSLLQENHTRKSKISGVKVLDHESGEEWDIPAKVVINATGPFSDSVRAMGDKNADKVIVPSAGVHIVLPQYFAPSSMGMLDPSTSDGRVIFFLPWQGRVIAGTTDSKCEVSASPIPTEAEIEFILSELRKSLSPQVKLERSDVLSAWSGIRPLVRDPTKLEDTSSVSRDFVVQRSEQGLISVAGGKWTTYRKMAEDTVDVALSVADINALLPSSTESVTLCGGEKYSPTHYLRLIRLHGLSEEVAKYLSHRYGDKAEDVIDLALADGKGQIEYLVPNFPYLKAEVRYGAKEYAVTAVDILARRLRLAFLDHKASTEALPVVIEELSKEFGWDSTRKQQELERGHTFLATMGATTQCPSSSS